MASKDIQRVSKKLEARRKNLGMSCAVLSKRSGVSRRTVVRILSGLHPRASIHKILSIAQTLGMTVTLKETRTLDQLRERQAQEKSKRIVGMVQGNCGLEGQVLGKKDLERLIRRTVDELLEGPWRFLWSD